MESSLLDMFAGASTATRLAGSLAKASRFCALQSSAPEYQASPRETMWSICTSSLRFPSIVVPVYGSCRIPSVASQRSEEHTSELQSRGHLVCRLLLEKKKKEQRHVRRT